MDLTQKKITSTLHSERMCRSPTQILPILSLTSDIKMPWCARQGSLILQNFTLSQIWHVISSWPEVNSSGPTVRPKGAVAAPGFKIFPKMFQFLESQN